MRNIIGILTFVDFRGENIEFDKVRGHCHLTGNYWSPAHSICNINVTQKQSSFILFVFHKYCNYDCHLCFEKLLDKKNDEVKFDNKPKTKEK